MAILKQDIIAQYANDLTPSGLFQNPKRIMEWYFSDKWKDTDIFTTDEFSIIENDLRQLKKGFPLEYLTGKAYFLGYVFHVEPSVLIPRPETEELVLWIQESEPEGQRILDIGTGSGCIAISLALSDHDHKVIGYDISKDALKVANRNAAKLKADVKFEQLDVLNIHHREWEAFDVIVSNPPYVRPSEASKSVIHEPEIALYTPEDDPLLYYKAIATFAEASLKKGGSLYFELSEYTGRDVVLYLNSLNFLSIEIRNDLSGKNRMLKAKKS